MSKSINPGGSQGLNDFIFDRSKAKERIASYGQRERQHEDTQAVKFRVKDIKNIIETNNLQDNDELNFILMTYTGDDYNLYQKKTWAKAMPSKEELNGRITLVIGCTPRTGGVAAGRTASADSGDDSRTASADTSSSSEAVYYDSGTICPPPAGSCDVTSESF